MSFLQKGVLATNELWNRADYSAGFSIQTGADFAKKSTVIVVRKDNNGLATGLLYRVQLFRL
jgi:hypothetical protein